MQIKLPSNHIYNLATAAEQTLLDVIIDTVEKGLITADEATFIAKDFLTLLPIRNVSDLCQKLHFLSDLHPTCNRIYLAYASVYETNTARKKSHILHSLLNQDAIDKAYSLYKGGVL